MKQRLVLRPGASALPEKTCSASSHAIPVEVNPGIQRAAVGTRGSQADRSKTLPPARVSQLRGGQLSRSRQDLNGLAFSAAPPAGDALIGRDDWQISVVPLISAAMPVPLPPPVT